MELRFFAGIFYAAPLGKTPDWQEFFTNMESRGSAARTQGKRFWKWRARTEKNGENTSTHTISRPDIPI